MAQQYTPPAGTATTVGAYFQQVFGCSIMSAAAVVRDVGTGKPLEQAVGHNGAELEQCRTDSECGTDCAIVLHGADAVLAVWGGWQGAPEKLLASVMENTLVTLFVMYYG